MKVYGKDTQQRIKEACLIDGRCADDDKMLIATIWKQEGWYDPNLYEKLCSVSSPETIRRCRQKLVQEGVIKPSKKTTEYRYNEFKQARKDLGYEQF